MRWIGPAPAPALASALRRAGVTIVRAPGGGSVSVVAARRLPAPPSGPWIWLCPRPAMPLAEAIAAVQAGAYDVLTSADADVAVRLAGRLREAATPADADPPQNDFIGRSPAARRVLAELGRAARTSMPVLLTGETGTGKDVAARIIHRWSARRERRFVPINCAAIPNELMESELFGYARGAFSGAVRPYDGQFLAAEGGTVFLDEIDDTPPTLQAKLLRVLEDRVISRLGENEWRTVDFRLIAATNRDLRALIAQGAFGEDLYERLAIVSIHLPPLRERVEDLPDLVMYFVDRFHDEERGEKRARVTAVAPAALAALRDYPWPGNVRELRNTVYQALVNKRVGVELLLSDLPARLLDSRADVGARPGQVIDRAALSRRIASGTFSLRQELAELERSALRDALLRAGGNAAAAARLLGDVGRGRARDASATVRAMMRRLGVSRRLPG